MQQLHIYYKRSGLYKFIMLRTLKLLAIIGVIVVALYLIERYVIDLNTLAGYVQAMPTPFVLIFFLFSESLLGLVPPDIFIAWTEQFEHSFAMLTLIATISYIGGLISYIIGQYLRKIKKVNDYLTVKYEQHISKIRKWGGVLIVIAALLPLPFSTVCMAAGLMHYPFIRVVLYGITRYIRFYIYAIFIFLAIA